MLVLLSAGVMPVFSAEYPPVQVFRPVRSDAHRGHQHLRVDQNRVQGGHQGMYYLVVRDLL